MYCTIHKYLVLFENLVFNTLQPDTAQYLRDFHNGLRGNYGLQNAAEPVPWIFVCIDNRQRLSLKRVTAIDCLRVSYHLSNLSLMLILAMLAGRNACLHQCKWSVKACKRCSGTLDLGLVGVEGADLGGGRQRSRGNS